MAILGFCISPGTTTSPANVESLITDPPYILPGDRMPYMGGNAVRTGDGQLKRSGAIELNWYWDYMSNEDFQLLIATIFGDFRTPSAAVSMKTIDVANVYALATAIVDQPMPPTGDQQGDYTIAPGGAGILDLRLHFYNVTPGGEHTFEFSSEFT